MLHTYVPQQSHSSILYIHTNVRTQEDAKVTVVAKGIPGVVYIGVVEHR